ncbi:MAG: phosphopantetheine-binding protein [Planctomycetia bacterium]|nr:phosphopantetheine-binding protein [Planctomycetia bacterium]
MKADRGSIFHFDATEVRRGMMKRRATSQQPWEGAFSPKKTRGKEKLPSTERVIPNAPVTESLSKENFPTREEMKVYITHFVMEQTGYPEEMITLDADLEGDLGIDSIKKAQLMGELNEMFCFADWTSGEDADLTLEDFPTLGHILDYMEKKKGKTETNLSVASQTPLFSEKNEESGISEPLEKTGDRDFSTPEEWKAYIVHFVMEQTGYPEEMITLDADLEGDLGIDSIKKAQLMGELNEMFCFVDLASDEDTDLTLEDFPTLGHILNYMAKKRVPKTISETEMAISAGGDSCKASPDMASPTLPTREELRAYIVNFVMEQTGYPEEMVTLDADLEGDLGIDSIKKAQLMGELNEMFCFVDLASGEDADLTLEDFPTLGHILDYMLRKKK